MDAVLPDYSNPPVVEVVTAVQFEPLKNLSTPQIGLLWSEFRDRFPQIEEHPPLDPMIERFDARKPHRPNVRIEMMDRPPVPRCWFLNESGNELVQVQQDRFVHNWRKVGDDDEYPRYEHVRDTFSRELETFERFLHRENIGGLNPNQCELTYVNHIPRQGRPGDLNLVLTLLNTEYSESFLPDLEEVRLSGSYVIPDEQNQPLGRLRFSCHSAYSVKDDQPIFQLNLVARGRPDGDGQAGVIRFMNTGRLWIVRGFTAITTRDMHSLWGRRDDRTSV
jgi:uncharacterized protein (TIGR04255 family)